MSLKFHFKLHCCISLKKLCSGLFCKGKTLYSNLFDLINGVYSNPFRMFHLQPIWLTIRYSKFILFVSQAVPAVNWYSDALKCLHCHCQAFSSVTISQLQQQNIQQDLKLQQQQCEKLKNWDCCIHLQDCTVSKYKRMQNGHWSKATMQKDLAVATAFKKKYFIITSRKTNSWRTVPEWTSISLSGIMYVAVGC